MAAANQIDTVARRLQRQIRKMHVFYVGEKKGEPATVAKREAGDREISDADEGEQLATRVEACVASRIVRATRIDMAGCRRECVASDAALVQVTVSIDGPATSQRNVGQIRACDAQFFVLSI